jgi:solute carrier family 13 (sodium-dependent dicarboxylate transporter), member 2/3/5
MLRWLLMIITIAGISAAAILVFDSGVLRLTTIIAGICLTLWLSELVPPFVPTLLLWTLTPILLGSFDKKFDLPNVLNWAIDPVLALFFGGFVLSVATERYGFDKRLANLALRTAGKSFAKFLLLAMLLTAFLSMWMSNIAAAALMLAALHPILLNFEVDDALRRAVLVGIALGADLGGISTPIGTGPNAIAIASISETTHISFLGWMSFALPLSLGMLFLSFAFIWLRVRRQKSEWATRLGQLSEETFNPENLQSVRAKELAFLLVLVGTVVLWLTETWHGISASVVSLGATSVLFLTRLLKKEDLLRVDWSTLLLIAGGITLGKLLEQSSLVKIIASEIAWTDLNATLALFLLCLASAVLSALMSNTATAVMLIPLAHALIPDPSTAILVAIAASFGIPFVISTPPNAMVYGEGGVRFGDLFLPGIIIMLLGCLIISLTGRSVLHMVGVF